MFWGKKKKKSEKAAVEPPSPPPPEPVAPPPAPPPIAQPQPETLAATHIETISPPIDIPPEVPPPPPPMSGGNPAPQPSAGSQQTADPSIANDAGRVFGEIVATLMRSPQYKTMALQELEYLVLPAMHFNQFQLVLDKSKPNNFPASLGVVFWAYVTPEIDARLTAQPDQAIRLAPQEWKSGDIAWVVDIVGTPQLMATMFENLKTGTFQGRSFKIRTKNETGQAVVQTIQPGS